MDPQLSADLAALCTNFEAAWRAGDRPAIEKFLPFAPSRVRAMLMRKLLKLELDLRTVAQEKIDWEEYGTRFPEDRELILAVFADTPTVIKRQDGQDDRSELLPAADSHLSTSLPAVPGYEIEKALTPGGMGLVYKARQIGTDRTVALKILRTGVHSLPEERARFRLEAEAIAALSHPHVVQIHDYGDWEGVPYLAMEFAEAGSLAHYLADQRLSITQAAELVQVLARAMHHVHERGIVHRDLKPANILLQKGPGVRGQRYLNLICKSQRSK
jgi:hypothetical protein